MRSRGWTRVRGVWRGVQSTRDEGRRRTRGGGDGFHLCHPPIATSLIFPRPLFPERGHAFGEVGAGAHAVAEFLVEGLA